MSTVPTIFHETKWERRASGRIKIFGVDILWWDDCLRDIAHNINGLTSDACFSYKNNKQRNITELEWSKQKQMKRIPNRQTTVVILLGIMRERKYNKRRIYQSCCSILKHHAHVLKNDPERLSTNFIKNLSKCECRKTIEG